jgi:hypothetical protein
MIVFSNPYLMFYTATFKDGRTMSITSHTSGGVKHKIRVTKNYHDCMKVNILMDDLIATMKRQKIYKLKQLLSH